MAVVPVDGVLKFAAMLPSSWVVAFLSPSSGTREQKKILAVGSWTSWQLKKINWLGAWSIPVAFNYPGLSLNNLSLVQRFKGVLVCQI